LLHVTPESIFIPVGSGGSKLLDGARSAARTIQNNLLDKDKQEAFDLLIHGTGRNTDFQDRARLLLPPKYLPTCPHGFIPLAQVPQRPGAPAAVRHEAVA
jgi:hypothetical protein